MSATVVDAVNNEEPAPVAEPAEGREQKVEEEPTQQQEEPTQLEATQQLEEETAEEKEAETAEEETIDVVEGEPRITEDAELKSQESSPSNLAEEESSPDIVTANIFTSDYFLSKHSPSFICFEQYPCSRSDLLMALNFFPPLTDPGIDEAFNFVEPEPEVDTVGDEKYKRMAKELGIVAISRILNSLPGDTLDLKYYGLTLKQMRCLADALKVNSTVRTLILQDNWMTPEAVVFISDILRENNTIRILNLRECRIGEEGAEKLAEGIATSQFLEELNLSFNSLGDVGLKLLKQGLVENTSIKKLNISHNELTEDSGETMEYILTENKAIEELDLSWNQFCTGLANKKLCNGLKKNEQLRWLSLAWNGIGTRPSMIHISKYLRRKATLLEYLDLSNNRITLDSLRLIRFALFKNKSLKHVKLGYNIYTTDEAFYLASVLRDAKRNELALLDLEGTCVTKDFIPLAQRIRKMGKEVIHGRVLSNYEIFGPNVNKLMFERCKYLTMKPKKKKKKKDFGHFILSLPDGKMTRPDFETFLKKKKVKKIDKDLLNSLMTNFQTRKGQKVDCEKMKSAFMALYPDTVLPPPPKKKKKKKKGRGRKKKGKGKKGEPVKEPEKPEEPKEEITLEKRESQKMIEQIKGSLTEIPGLKTSQSILEQIKGSLTKIQEITGSQSIIEQLQGSLGRLQEIRKSQVRLEDIKGSIASLKGLASTKSVTFSRANVENTEEAATNEAEPASENPPQDPPTENNPTQDS